MSRQLKLGNISPILDSHTSSDRFAAHPAGSGDTPRASNRSAWRQETGVILEMLARFINHHISPLNIEDSEVLEKAVRVAKHLITVSCLMPRPLLLDACGSVSDFNAVPLKGDSV